MFYILSVLHKRNVMESLIVMISSLSRNSYRMPYHFIDMIRLAISCFISKDITFEKYRKSIQF